MLWLILASLIWAFSFGLIKGLIVGLDPFLMGTIRMGFAFAVSLLCFRLQSVHRRDGMMIALAGMIQLGLMYAPYLLSFRYLKAHEVALFTMTTPILVVAVHQLAERTFSIKIIGAAFVAIAGGVVVAFKALESNVSEMVFGILLVQLANVLFAVGQFIYAKASPATAMQQLRGAPYYFGGALFGSAVVLAFMMLVGQTVRMPLPNEWAVLAWLGIVSSGIGFALWNYGVSRVRYGALAVASDFKLPVAVLVSVTVFGESANPMRLAIGMLILLVATAMVR